MPVAKPDADRPARPRPEPAGPVRLCLRPARPHALLALARLFKSGRRTPRRLGPAREEE